MIKKLYIIGNGFDLHHFLKTSYYDFANYLRKQYKDIYDTLEYYVSYPSSDKDLWSNFEANLANLNAEELLSEHSDTLPNYASDAFRDRDRYVFPDIMEDHYQKLTTELFSAFEEFIRKVEFPDYSRKNKIFLDKDASFLTFNYTNTLERFYSINKSNIIYIHNSVFYGSDRVILGHGIDPKTFEEEKREPPKNLNPQQLEDWYNCNMNDDYDYSYDLGKQTLMQYFQDTYKPTRDVITRHLGFFKKLTDTKEIFVLGHSLSSVDLPYFEQIVSNVKKDVKWVVSYYNIDEYKRHFMTLKSLNIEGKNIMLVKLEDLQENNKQLKFDFSKKKKENL